MPDLDLTGLDSLAVDLGRAGLKATRLASLVVAKTAQDIEGTAKTLAPVDTGNLRDSIGSSIQPLSAEIGPTANYGIHLEYGTARMAPQPFMGPALDAHAKTFEAAMAKVAGL